MSYRNFIIVLVFVFSSQNILYAQKGSEEKFIKEGYLNESIQPGMTIICNAWWESSTFECTHCGDKQYTAEPILPAIENIISFNGGTKEEAAEHLKYDLEAAAFLGRKYCNNANFHKCEYKLIDKKKEAIERKYNIRAKLIGVYACRECFKTVYSTKIEDYESYPYILLLNKEHHHDNGAPCWNLYGYKGNQPYKCQRCGLSINIASFPERDPFTDGCKSGESHKWRQNDKKSIEDWAAVDKRLENFNKALSQVENLFSENKITEAQAAFLGIKSEYIEKEKIGDITLTYTDSYKPIENIINFRTRPYNNFESILIGKWNLKGTSANTTESQIIAVFDKEYRGVTLELTTRLVKKGENLPIQKDLITGTFEIDKDNKLLIDIIKNEIIESTFEEELKKNISGNNALTIKDLELWLLKPKKIELYSSKYRLDLKGKKE